MEAGAGDLLDAVEAGVQLAQRLGMAICFRANEADYTCYPHGKVMRFDSEGAHQWDSQQKIFNRLDAPAPPVRREIEK